MSKVTSETTVQTTSTRKPRRRSTPKILRFIRTFLSFPNADDSRMDREYNRRISVVWPEKERITACPKTETNVARRELASSTIRPRQPYRRLASPTDYVVLVDRPGGRNQVIGANYCAYCGCSAQDDGLR